MMDTPRVIGLIGDPVAHSLSPALHNTLFAHHHLPFVYLPLRVRSAQLGALLQCMCLADVEGINVTAPHKLAIVPLLDRLDRHAAAIVAVNTVVVRRRRSTGFNTDAPGVLAALQHTFRTTPRGMQVALIGAGGAAHAVAYAVLNAHAESLTILDRTQQRARHLAERLAARYPRATIQALPLTPSRLRTALAGTDLLVQAGSAPPRGRGHLPWVPCQTNARILDLRYGANTNTFLDGARRQGLRVADGLEMLIQQAALSFALWTGVTPDLDHLRRTLRRDPLCPTAPAKAGLPRRSR